MPHYAHVHNSFCSRIQRQKYVGCWMKMHIRLHNDFACIAMYGTESIEENIWSSFKSDSRNLPFSTFVTVPIVIGWYWWNCYKWSSSKFTTGLCLKFEITPWSRKTLNFTNRLIPFVQISISIIFQKNLAIIPYQQMSNVVCDMKVDKNLDLYKSASKPWKS